MVIESIDNIEVAYELCKIHNVYMPIVETVYKVIYENLKPEDAVKDLMTRDKKVNNKIKISNNKNVTIKKGENVKWNFLIKLEKKHLKHIRLQQNKTGKIAKETKMKLKINGIEI